jgi:hypothetical protein
MGGAARSRRSRINVECRASKSFGVFLPEEVQGFESLWLKNLALSWCDSLKLLRHVRGHSVILTPSPDS